MQEIPNLLQIRNSIKTLCEVDSTIIQSISELNNRVSINTDAIAGFGASQTLTNILIGGLIAVGVLICILITIKK